MNITITQNLERSYGLFIDREDTLSFFKGLAEYANYVFSVPILAAVVDEQMAERDTGYKKLEALEKQAEAELHKVKKKLLSAVKRNGVDTTTFKRHQTFNTLPDILKELEAFENGGIIKSGFYAQGLWDYCFDIAANLLQKGYEEEVQEFLVSSEKYGEYHDRINEPSEYTTTGNKHGNFIFSNTLADCYRQQELIGRERKLKPWGAFEKIMMFKFAYEMAIENTDLSVVLRRAKLDFHKGIDVARMVSDLEILTGKKTEYAIYATKPDGLDFLHKEKFKAAVQTVHNRILQTLTDAKDDGAARTPALKLKDVVFDESQPAIFIGDKKCSLPPAKNEEYLAKVMFARPTGEFVDWSIIYKEMTGTEAVIGSGQDSKSVRDTMNRLNKRVQEVIGTNDKLLSWKNKSVCRNF